MSCHAIQHVMHFRCQAALAAQAYDLRRLQCPAGPESFRSVVIAAAYGAMHVLYVTSDSTKPMETHHML